MVMVQVKVPGAVRKILAPDEQVVDKLSTPNQDFYATTQRLISYRKSEMWMILGWLWYLMAQKKYSGSLEYSKISNIAFVSFRSKAVIAMALVLVLVCLYFGILFFSLPGAAVVGVFFIAFGILFGGFLCLRKFKFHQLESPGLSKKEMEKWRIPAGRNNERFVNTVRAQIGK